MQESQTYSQTISYELSRRAVTRVLFRRLSLRYRRVRTMVLLLIAATLFYSATDIREFHYLAFAMFAVVLWMPWSLYRGLRAAVDQNPRFTDPKTVSFSPAGLIASGPDYKTELAWTYFGGFSEDDNYFYLHYQTDSASAALIPKSAFTPAQEDEFRRYATDRLA